MSPISGYKFGIVKKKHKIIYIKLYRKNFFFEKI